MDRLRLSAVAVPMALLCLLLPGPAALAASTSAATARTAASTWVKRTPKHLGGALGTQIDRVETFRDENSDPVYYVVYLKPSGFLVVSADDCVEPVVCFVRSGTYDPSEDNPLGALVGKDLAGRLKASRDNVEKARSAGREFAPAGRFLSARKKWEQLTAAAPGLETSVASVSDPRVDPLVSSRWNQLQIAGTDCYNYYTPNNYYCGCVATAMAQLMRYHQHPVAGVGTGSFAITVSGAGTTESLRGGDGAGGAYVWAQMMLVPDGTITLAQRQAIGALTHDAGVSVNMDYAATGSGADTLVSATQFTTTFGYANAVKGYNGGANIGAGLTAMLNPDLDASLPALLGITGPSGGHAVVCDGYGYEGGTLYHHLNMGWSGIDDAWYDLPDIDAVSYTFNTVYKCVYNVYKTGSGEIVSGRVTDDGGTPIDGATVTATRSGGGSYNATSNARGIYALTGLPSASNYTVAATKAGYTFANQAASTGTSSNLASTPGNYWGLDFAAEAPDPAPAPAPAKKSSGGGGGGGGCSLAAAPGSAGGAAGSFLPFLAMAAAWLLARLRRRGK